jgi:hypothetical protein
VAVCALALLLTAQSGITIEQLVSFIRSSIQLRHPDKQVAAYLGKIKLTEQLDDRTIEDLDGQGAGPKTLEALRALRDASRSLPKAPVQEPPKAVPLIPPPPATDQIALLHRVRDYALNYSKSLPNFICTQVTRRYYDPSGLEFWRAEDTLTARLSYFDQREDYKLIMVDNQLTDRPFESVGGATSTGEFGSMLKFMFDPDSYGEFKWSRWATLRGHRMYVFSYRIPQAHSQWRLNYDHQLEIVTGYHGEVFVDKETDQVMRATFEADNIPPSFPIHQATSVLDYDYANVGEQKYLLPLKAVVRMRQAQLLTKNDVEFRMYRKFSTESTISFTPDPLPDDQTKEEPPKPETPAQTPQVEPQK